MDTHSTDSNQHTHIKGKEDEKSKEKRGRTDRFGEIIILEHSDCVREDLRRPCFVFRPLDCRAAAVFLPAGLQDQLSVFQAPEENIRIVPQTRLLPDQDMGPQRTELRFPDVRIPILRCEGMDREKRERMRKRTGEERSRTGPGGDEWNRRKMNGQMQTNTLEDEWMSG